MSKTHARKVKKLDPEVVEFAEEFQNELEERSAGLKKALDEYWKKIDAEMSEDIEMVGEFYDLEMPIGDYFEIRKAANAQDNVSVEDSEAEQLEEKPKPLAVEGTPRVDAALPGGGHLRVPALIRPKIVEGVFALRQPKPNEIAFSLNGTPLQMTSRVKEEPEESMEYVECD